MTVYTLKYQQIASDTLDAGKILTHAVTREYIGRRKPSPQEHQTYAGHYTVAVTASGHLPDRGYHSHGVISVRFARIDTLEKAFFDEFHNIQGRIDHRLGALLDGLQWQSENNPTVEGQREALNAYIRCRLLRIVQ